MLNAGSKVFLGSCEIVYRHSRSNAWILQYAALRSWSIDGAARSDGWVGCEVWNAQVIAQTRGDSQFRVDAELLVHIKAPIRKDML